MTGTTTTIPASRLPAPSSPSTASTGSPRVLVREEVGAATAEYAAVTACGVGLAGVLMKLLTSDFGQGLLKAVFEFFLKMVGIG